MQLRYPGNVSVYEALQDWAYCGAPDLSECGYLDFASSFGLETFLGAPTLAASSKSTGGPTYLCLKMLSNAAVLAVAGCTFLKGHAQDQD